MIISSNTVAHHFPYESTCSSNSSCNSLHFHRFPTVKHEYSKTPPSGTQPKRPRMFSFTPILKRHKKENTINKTKNQKEDAKSEGQSHCLAFFLGSFSVDWALELDCPSSTMERTECASVIGQSTPWELSTSSSVTAIAKA